MRFGGFEDLHRRGRVGSFGGFIRDDLHTTYQAEPAHIADEWEFAQRLQACKQARSQFTRALWVILFFHDLEILQSHRARHRMTRIGISMHVRFAVRGRFHRLANSIGDLDTAELGISARDGFCERKNIRLHIPMLEREPFACAPKARDDLVRDEEHFVFVADLSDEREVIVGWNDHASDTHDRLGDESGDSVGSFAQNGGFQFPSRRLPDSFPILQLTFVAIRIRRGDVDKSIHGGTEHGVIFFQPRGKCRGKRHAVIRAAPRNDLVLGRLALALPVIARGLER